MKNRLMALGLIVVIGGIAAGIHYKNRTVIAVAFASLGIFSAACGMQMILTRKATIATSDSLHPHREYHTGLSAQLTGLLFVMFSVPLGAFGVLYWLYGDDPPRAIVDNMAKSPLMSGAIIVCVGAAIAMYGLTRVLPGKAGFVETGIGPVERRLSAIYLCVIGTLLILVGVVRISSPGTLTRLRDAGIAWVLQFFK